jgi:putative transposase
VPEHDRPIHHERSRLAAKGRALGRRVLSQLRGLVTPDTILRWYRELIANKGVAA